MAFKPSHTENEIISRVEIKDFTAFNAIEVLKLHTEVRRNFRNGDSYTRRKMYIDTFTLMCFQRLNILLTPFKETTSNTIEIINQSYY